jgi:hypothetical protein
VVGVSPVVDVARQDGAGGLQADGAGHALAVAPAQESGVRLCAKVEALRPLLELNLKVRALRDVKFAIFNVHTYIYIK